MYRLEEHLVEDFVSNLLCSPFAEWNHLSTTTEFNYKRGRADIIALNSNGHIIAFEAKLKKWREALHQAYRNTCFAHYSFVLLPEETANQAIRYVAEFSRRSVGICYLSDEGVIIAHSAPYMVPIQKWLSELAVSTILEKSADEQFQSENQSCSRNLCTKAIKFSRESWPRCLQGNFSYSSQ